MDILNVDHEDIRAIARGLEVLHLLDARLNHITHTQEQIMSDLTRLNAAISSLEGLVTTLAGEVANAANADQPALDAAAQSVEEFVAANQPAQ